LKGLVRAVLTNAVGLVLIYLVLLDYSWRSSYALSAGWVPSVSYLPFLRYLQLTGHGLTVVSPPTLDWVQVIAVFLIAVDSFYLYRYLAHSEAAERSSSAG
jgi:hypothetical protein